MNYSLNSQIGTSISDRRKANIDVEFDRREVNDRRSDDRRQSSVPVENDRRLSADTFTDRRGVNAAFGEDSADRRKVDFPVEKDRRGVNDSVNIDKQPSKILKEPKKENLFFDALETLPPVRRLKSLPDKMEQGEGTTALGMASLALINLPEDMRDIRGAIRQFRGIEPSYDYTKCQHPFSFFRGTFLKGFANPNTASNPKLAWKILNSDKTLAQTTFGEKILSILGVEKVDKIKTKIQAIDSTIDNPIFVKAQLYKGTAFGKLTARALERSTVWGLGAIIALELPQMIGTFCHEGGLDEKTKNGTKQIIKSAINIAAITAGIGYMGALGAKYGGPAGSLIGMGTGAVLGGYGSKKFQELIH